MVSNELGSDGQCVGWEGASQTTSRIFYLQLFPAMVFYLFQKSLYVPYG